MVNEIGRDMGGTSEKKEQGKEHIKESVWEGHWDYKYVSMSKPGSENAKKCWEVLKDCGKDFEDRLKDYKEMYERERIDGACWGTCWRFWGFYGKVLRILGNTEE